MEEPLGPGPLEGAPGQIPEKHGDEPAHCCQRRPQSPGALNHETSRRKSRKSVPKSGGGSGSGTAERNEGSGLPGGGETPRAWVPLSRQSRY